MSSRKSQRIILSPKARQDFIGILRHTGKTCAAIPRVSGKISAREYLTRSQRKVVDGAGNSYRRQTPVRDLSSLDRISDHPTINGS
jgi:plasmid stabilization system protein ParE